MFVIWITKYIIDSKNHTYYVYYVYKFFKKLDWRTKRGFVPLLEGSDCCNHDDDGVVLYRTKKEALQTLEWRHRSDHLKLAKITLSEIENLS